MKKLSTLTAAVLLAVSGFAFADAATVAQQDNKYYVGVVGGYGKLDKTIAGTENSNKGFTYGANAGYMFTKNFGAEIGFEHYQPAFFSGADYKSNYNMHVAAVGVMPFANNFDAFAKLGVADVHTNIEYHVITSATDAGKHNDLAGYGALGLGYAVTSNVTESVELDGTTKSGNVPAMYSANVGVAYKF